MKTKMQTDWSEIDREIDKQAVSALVLEKPHRKRVRAACEIIALGLSLALIWLALGCRTQLDPGPYKGDAFLFNADKVIVDSKEDLSRFLKWELINRPAITEHNLQSITKAADAIRNEGPLWFTNAMIARNNYSNSVALRKPPETISALSNSLAGNISALKTQTLSTRALTNSVNLK